MMQRWKGRTMIIKGLCVIFTHQQAYFPAVILIIVGETLTAPLGVCLETHAR